MSQIPLTDINQHVGTVFGPTASLEITQERVNEFAEATGDFQWIHVDPERAAAESPFGGPIAHGYLTLSLVNYFLPQLVEVTGASMGVNVGVDKVRFPSPVPVGASVSATAELLSAEEVKGGVQTTIRVSITVDGSSKPSCVVDTLSRFFP